VEGGRLSIIGKHFKFSVRVRRKWRVAPAAAKRQVVLPLQPGWPHLQSISGVFAVFSHCTLQYVLPSPTWQEQFGCAHFLDSLTTMMSFLSFENVRLGPLASTSAEFLQTTPALPY